MSFFPITQATEANPRFSARKVLHLVVVMTIIAAMLSIRISNASAATRAFTSRFSQNITGDIAFVANTIMTCGAVANCATGQAGTNVGAANNNNGLAMVYVDSDADATTFSSSSAALNMPTGATVLFAGLYWGGFSANAARNTVKFATPMAAYATVTASQLDFGTSDYQGFANVTAAVAAAGNGTYTVANVQSTVGTNQYGGWTLAVAYQDPNGIMRNLTVFDGYQSVSATNPVTIPVSGFLTPPNGAVNTKLGVVAYEGDRGTTGDVLSLNSVVMSDAVNATDNFFNSSISNVGANVGSKNPNYINQLGYDSDILAVPNAGNAVLANSATTASISLTSTGDVYYPGVVTFVTDLYSPKMAITKVANDVNGGVTRPGDEVEYTITVTNSGDDSAIGNVLTDPLPFGVTYVPNSLQIVSGVNAGAKTDAQLDDQGEYNAGVVKFFLGVGATGLAGGDIVKMATPGSPTTTVLKFKVTVNSTVGDNVTIANTASLSYTAFTLGTASAAAGVAPTTGAGPIQNTADLSIVKTLTTAVPVPGQTVNYDIVVSNIDPLANAVVGAPVQDTLPATLSGATWTCVASTGSTCAAASGTGNINSTVDLLKGGTATYSLTALVAASATGLLSNTSTVTAPTGVTDGTLTNNSSKSEVALVPTADLVITKTNGVLSTSAGNVVAYTVEASNVGPSNVTGALVTDNPPSAIGAINWTCVGTVGGSCPATGTGNLASAVNLPVGGKATFTVTYTVDPAASGTKLDNVATIAAPVGVSDPTSTNDSATDSDTLLHVANFSLAKTHPVGPVAPGTNVTYTITATNAGPATASAASITDTLPAGMTFVSISSPTLACPAAPTGSAASCTGTSIPVGVSTITVVAAIDPTATGSAPNVAVLTSTDDPDSSNNTASDPTPLTPNADISIQKSHLPATLVAGTNVTYTLDVTNAGPSNAATAVVTDNLPAGLTLVSASGSTGWTCTTAVSCSYPSLPIGNSTITIVAKVDPSFAGPSVANTATVASPTADPDSLDRTSLDTAPVTRIADVEVLKSHTSAVIAGTPIAYTITVSNYGPSATTATVSDPLPSALSGASWTCVATAGSVCPASGAGTIANTPISLGANGKATFTLNALVSPTASTSFDNTATATVPAGVTDPTAGNNTGIDNSAPTISADLSIVKTDGVNSATPGSVVTYTITAANAGPSAVTGAAITDTLPASLLNANWTCIASVGSLCAAPSGTGSIASSADLLANGSAIYTLTATIDPKAVGSLVNDATIGVPAGVTDAVIGNNLSQDTDALNASADLGITKTDNAASAIPGTATSYTLKVTNTGPSFVTGAQVTDTVPASLTGVTWTCVATGVGSTCPATGNGNISALVDLAPTGIATFTLTGTISPTATGKLTNAASVVAPVGVADPNPLNDAASDDSDLLPRASVKITKTNNTTTPVPGQNTTYVLVVTNSGPSAAPGVTITDTLSAQLLTPTWTCVADPGSTCASLSGAGNVNTSADLSATGKVTYTVTARIDPAAAGTLSNSAIATVPPTITDPDLTDNNPTDSDPLSPTADIAIVKSDNLAPQGATAGQPLTYTVKVTNNGPSRANGITVTDALPTSLLNPTWDCTATAGSTCGSTIGTGSILSTVNLDPAGVATFVLVATVDGNATGTLVNKASVAYPAGVTDPTPGLTESTDTLPIARKADLTITKTDNATEVTPGLVTTYTIVVTNNGPSSITGATVTDTMPTQLVNPTWTCAASAGAACINGGGSGNISALIDLPVAGTATFVISATVDQSARVGVLTNTVSVAVPAGVVDPTPSNTATDTSNIVPIADLVMTKTDNATTAVAGTTNTYTIVVTNRGPSAVIGARVVDTVGGKLLNAAWTCVVAPLDLPSQCPTATGTGDINTTVDLAAFATATYTVSGTINPALRGSLNNTAAVTMPVGTGDPMPLNNTASDGTVLTTLTDLSVVKTNNLSESAPGQVVPYTITVSNAGPSTATNVHLQDPMTPIFLSFAWTCSAGVGSSCPASSGTGAIDQLIAAVAPGSTVTYSLQAKVSPGARGTLQNSVTISGTEPDADPNNDSSTDTDDLVPKADLRIAKTDMVENVIPGLPTGYVITVYNDGPSDIVDAEVADVMPKELTDVTWTCDATEPGTRCATISGSGDLASLIDIPSGTKIVFTVKASLAATLPAGTLANTATVKSPAGVADPKLDNNTSTDKSELVPHSNLKITKTDNSETQTPGEEATYTIVVTNDGPSNAMQAKVSDLAPKNFTKTSWVCQGTAGAVCFSAGTGQLLNVPVDLPANSSATLQFKGLIDAEASGVFENTATVFPGSGVDDNPSDNTAKDTSKLVAKVDLVTTKTDGAEKAVPGKDIKYTMTVTNNGPSASGLVKITDALPKELLEAKWKCVISGGGNGKCTVPSGTGSIATTVSLSAGQTATFELTAKVDPDAEVGTLTNSFKAEPNENAVDTDLSNNEATDVDDLTPEVDLSVKKSHAGGDLEAGGKVTYTITVSNGGPSSARGMKVEDTLPAGLLNAKWTCKAATGSTCPAAGDGSISAEANVKAKSAVVFTLTADVDPDAEKEIENTATITPAKGAKDKSDDDNSSSDKAKVVHRGDVSITKTDGKDYAVQGRRVTYTIVVSNAGPSGAKGVKVTDNTEKVLEGVSWTCTPTSGKGTCSSSGGDGDPVDVKVDLPPKSSVTFLVSAILDAKAQGDLRNTVSVNVDTDQFEDTNLANNRATDKDHIWKEWLKNPPKDSAPKPVKQKDSTVDVASKVEQALDENVPPVLALTGSEVAGLLFIGTLMIGFGSILVVGGRRRKRRLS
jgi:uncharacterized repeat protein (TIGR01451 family)